MMKGHRLYLAAEFEKFLKRMDLLDKFLFHLEADHDKTNFFNTAEASQWVTQAFKWPSYSVWPSVNDEWQKFLSQIPAQQKLEYEEVTSNNVVALDNIHNDVSEIRFRLAAIKKKLNEIEGWLGV